MYSCSIPWTWMSASPSSATVVAQTAMVLMHRGSGKGFNALGEQPHKERVHEHQECEGCEGDYTSEENAAWEQELLAEFRRAKGGGKGGNRRPKGGGKGRPATTDNRQPRRCPNCAGTHPEIKCPHPEVDRKDRQCWVCKKTGHNSAQCPTKKPGAALRTVTEEAGDGIRRIGVVSYANSDDGFSPARKTFRPRPTEVTVEHFLHNNRFSGLSQRERKNEQPSKTI